MKSIFILLITAVASFFCFFKFLPDIASINVFSGINAGMLASGAAGLFAVAKVK